jgi:type I restriction enzyme S subunit
MRAHWKETIIGEVVDFFDHKRIPLNSRERIKRRGIYPYYGASGIFDYIDGYLFDGRYLLIAEDGENLNSRKLPIAFLATGRFWVNNHAHIVRGKVGIANDKFLKHFFAATNISGYITGAAQPKLSQANLRIIKIALPEIDEQRKIAAILSAYDDLIENNMRRIQILEEMAWRIYEEWFVRFRFPGHENVGTTESELGLIPVGWKISTVADTFDVLGGGTPPTSVEEYWHDGSINWYAPTDLTRSGQVFIDESADKITPLGLAKSSARMFPAFSVMMTSRATLGVIAINTTEACTNQGFINCIPSKRFPLYVLFHWLKQNVGLFISLATGATFKEITKGNFKQIKLLLPPAILINRFQNLVEPMMQQLLNLQRKNSNLRRTRDLLLPKLISGEIDISNFPEPITD